MISKAISKEFKQACVDYINEIYQSDAATVLKLCNDVQTYINNYLVGREIDNIQRIKHNGVIISEKVIKNRVNNGETIEQDIIDILTENYNIIPHANGVMEFPDIMIKYNDLIIPFDVKAVKCILNEKTNNLKMSFNNSIETHDIVYESLNKYFKSGVADNIVKSFVIFTYYENKNGITYYGCHVVPTILAIDFYTNSNVLRIKSAGDEGKQIKNPHVTISLVQKDRRTWEEHKQQLINTEMLTK